MAYRPWPQEAYQLYKQIKTSQDTIEDFCLFCLTSDNRRFKEIPVTLMPIIKDEAAKIRRCAVKISRLRPKRGGRDPKWYMIAEEIEEMAANIEIIIKEEVTPALKINQMPAVWEGIQAIHQQSGEITKALKQIPPPVKPSKRAAGLEAWVEAAEIVNERLSR